MSPGTAVRPFRSTTSVQRVAPSLPRPTATKRSPSTRADSTTWSRPSIVWILPFVSSRSRTSGQGCAYAVDAQHARAVSARIRVASERLSFFMARCYSNAVAALSTHEIDQHFGARIVGVHAVLTERHLAPGNREAVAPRTNRGDQRFGLCRRDA